MTGRGNILREPEGKRLEIYEFIISFLELESWAPSLDEIADAVGLSKSTVKQHMDNLERDGVIERGPGNRQIRIPR